MSAMNLDTSIAREARHEIYKEEMKNLYRDKIKKNVEGRKWEYLQDNKNKTIKTMAICGITGVGTGIVIGATCGALCGTPGGPIGSGIGATIGGTAGGLVGFAIASAAVYYDYNQWQKTEEGKLLGGQIIPFLSEDPILRDLVCCISQDIATDPVKTPDGHIYERKVIEQWIDQNGTNPMTRQPLTKDMLQPANDVTGKVASAMIKMLDEDVATLKGIDKGFINGLKSLRKGIEKRRDNDYNSEVIKLQALRKQDKISGKDLSTAMAKIQQDFYPN